MFACPKDFRNAGPRTRSASFDVALFSATKWRRSLAVAESPMALALSGLALATGESGSTFSGELPAASALPLTKRVPLGC